MQRLGAMDAQAIIDYHLRDNGTAVSVFADTQTYRVNKAREFVIALLGHLTAPATIWELGSSAGDIGGFFSAFHDVHGVDVVPAAVELTKTRYPNMKVELGQAEHVTPVKCDILILTEFLEHIDDPVALVKAWLPLARYVVIGHPLNDPGTVEPGHIWTYTLADYMAWYPMGGHEHIESHLFAGPFPEMVLGCGRRV